jgi:chitodextrinase
MTHITLARRILPLVGLAAVVAAAGCTMKRQDAPALAGPSSFATSLTVTASPDIMTQDGTSQSVIAVVARDASSQPIPNLPLRIDLTVDGLLANDFGRLSTQNVTTGSDGRASLVYTAPASPPGQSNPETVVRIHATPVGTNFDNANSWSVTIRLVQPAIIYVPGSPFPQFTFAPSAPKAGQDVSFDASGSSDPDGFIVKYQWTYGDGDTEFGETQLHDFPKAGTYSVTLTVTDNAGNRASTSRTITVG